jgi:small subunit ribosomal protein S16
MVRLRLRRTGSKNKACFRIVAADAKSPRDGRFIEVLGYYDPRHEDEKVNLERAEHWLNCGAQPSETVAAIIDRAKKGAGALKQPKKEIKPAPAPTVEKTAEVAKEAPATEEAPAAAEETEAKAEEDAKAEAEETAPAEETKEEAPQADSAEEAEENKAPTEAVAE